MGRRIVIKPSKLRGHARSVFRLYREGRRMPPVMEEIWFLAARSLPLLEVGANPVIVNHVAASMLYSEATRGGC